MGRYGIQWDINNLTQKYDYDDVNKIILVSIHAINRQETNFPHFGDMKLNVLYLITAGCFKSQQRHITADKTEGYEYLHA